MCAGWGWTVIMLNHGRQALPKRRRRGKPDESGRPAQVRELRGTRRGPSRGLALPSGQIELLDLGRLRLIAIALTRERCRSSSPSRPSHRCTTRHGRANRRASPWRRHDRFRRTSLLPAQISTPHARGLRSSSVAGVESRAEDGLRLFGRKNRGASRRRSPAASSTFLRPRAASRSESGSHGRPMIFSGFPRPVPSDGGNGIG